MSNESPQRHVADWIEALFDALEAAEPQRAAAIRALAGKTRAFIALDKDVAFRSDILTVRRTGRIGRTMGRTCSETVADILAGYAEVSQAIADGRIEIRGTAADVISMASIIEILVDASTRIPAMQALSADFLAERGITARSGAARFRERLTRRAAQKSREIRLLEREGLLN